MWQFVVQAKTHTLPIQRNRQRNPLLPDRDLEML